MSTQPGECFSIADTQETQNPDVVAAAAGVAGSADSALARLSVVIPAFNAAGYLPDALRSLQAQSFSDWEAVVVDDGSTDGTARIVSEFAATDARVRLVQQPNRGASSARNLGLAHARGTWLLFLDSDDWLLPDFLEKMFAALDADPSAEFVCCPYHRVMPDGSHSPVEWWPDVVDNPFEVFAYNCALCIHCVITKRELIVEVGGFDTELKTCEDWDLWQRIARTGIKFTALDEPLGRYRVRAGSLSHDMSSMFTDALVVMARARKADPRVPRPAPQYAGGITGDNAEANLHVTCWLAGIEAGSGGSGLELLEKLPKIFDCKDDCEPVAGGFMHGYELGAKVPPGTLVSLWPRIEAAATPIFDRVAQASVLPELDRQLMYSLESQLLKRSDLSEPVTLSRVTGVRLDIRRRTPVRLGLLGAAADAVHVELRAGDELLGHITAPIWGAISSRELADCSVQQSGLKKIIRGGGFLRSPLFWFELALCSLRSTSTVWQIARGRRGPYRKRQIKALPRQLIGEAVVATIDRRIVPDGGAGHSRADTIIAEERARADAGHPPMTVAGQSDDAHEASESDRKAYWENIFSDPDPWNYGSPYEQAKYERTLSLLDGEPVASALEIACAEGFFSHMLAAHCERLHAVDISSTAVKRASERCREHTNITYGELDIIGGRITGLYDLIVCSEMLYFATPEELEAIAGKCRDALQPNGRLLTAHAFCLSDDRTRTGFDWGHEFGARKINETFAATEGLVLERSIVTELYRIDLFRKRSADAEPAPPVIAEMEVDTSLDLDVERHVIRGGAEILRGDIEDEPTNILTVLAYHRVGHESREALSDYCVTPERFEEQIALLRRHGWHSVTTGELWAAMRDQAPLHGKPVLITFDDGFRDFAENAWPVLQRNDFGAEVFVVTDLVGGRAEWDAQYGTPPPLLDWQQIAALSGEGVGFGSHFSTHRPPDALSSEELLREAAHSKFVLERRLGKEAFAVATPFGSTDTRLQQIYRICGYKLAFTTEWTTHDVRRKALSIPRIEVGGDWDIEKFRRIVIDGQPVTDED